MSSKSSFVVSVLLTITVLASVFFSGIYVGFTNRPEIEKVVGVVNKEEGAVIGVDFAPFWKTWNIINEKYVSADGTTDQEKVWGAIKGLAASLNDPYTVFFPPEEAEKFQEDISGSFQGVGMEIGMRNDVLTVIAPLKGTPAEEAGVLPGDKIIQIDDVVTAPLSIDEAVSLIRGEAGTKVVLTIVRKEGGEPIEIPIIRAVIDIPTIDTEVQTVSGGKSENGVGLVADNVFVIRLFNFYASAPRRFREALREFVKSGADKLIIDLRGNPGGFLEAAVDIASWFLPAGKVIVREDIGEGEEGRVYRSKGYDIFNENLKLAILVNGGSASASEILAGALREHGIATVVGQKTFGKGSVQELVDITEDTALKVTVARWLTPNGNSISKEGITPDVEVEMTLDDVEAGVDPQLEKAIEILAGK
jgi:carboxyl-terminal processing protease